MKPDPRHNERAEEPTAELNGASPIETLNASEAALGRTRPLLIAVTQSVLVEKVADGPALRRDGLDQAWARLIEACGFCLLPVPNQPGLATQLLDQVPVDGVLLTCGNELAANGGGAPERDRTEYMLVTHAVHRKLPVLGVGRGMQVIQRMFSVPTEPAPDHVPPALENEIDGRRAAPAGNHRVSASLTAPDVEVWARAEDGVVKAIRIDRYRITGIMWRPETKTPFSRSDVELIRRAFGARGRAGGAAHVIAGPGG